MEEQARQILADLLDVEPGSITAETSMDNTAKWDSLLHINFIAALEEELEVDIDFDEMEAMLSFHDVVDVLQRKQ